MKKDLHPSEYRPMVIKDSNSGFAFLTRTSAKTNETIKWEDGNEYPLLTVHISSSSHPFYTGEEKIVDVEGRVDRFKARQEAAKLQKVNLANKAKKANKIRNEKPVTKATKIGSQINSEKSKVKNNKPEIKSQASPANNKPAVVEESDVKKESKISNESKS